MPTNSGGLDEWNTKMEALRLLIQNYDRAITVLKGESSEEDFELYKQILADDKKIREVLK